MQLRIGASSSAGSKSRIAICRILAIFKPIANSSRPPQALKSASICGVICGISHCDSKYSAVYKIICGRLIHATIPYSRMER